MMVGPLSAVILRVVMYGLHSYLSTTAHRIVPIPHLIGARLSHFYHVHVVMLAHACLISRQTCPAWSTVPCRHAYDHDQGSNVCGVCMYRPPHIFRDVAAPRSQLQQLCHLGCCSQLVLQLLVHHVLPFPTQRRMSLVQLHNVRHVLRQCPAWLQLPRRNVYMILDLCHPCAKRLMHRQRLWNQLMMLHLLLCPLQVPMWCHMLMACNLTHFFKKMMRHLCHLKLAL